MLLEGSSDNKRKKMQSHSKNNVTCKSLQADFPLAMMVI